MGLGVGGVGAFGPHKPINNKGTCVYVGNTDMFMLDSQSILAHSCTLALRMAALAEYLDLPSYNFLLRFL